MAALYGSLRGNRGETTRLGHKDIRARLETWAGAVTVVMDADGHYRVYESTHGKHSTGDVVHTGKVDS